MKKLLVGILIVISICTCTYVYADITSPYGKWTIIKPIFTTTVDPDGHIVLHQVQKVHFIKNPFVDFLGYIQRGIRPLINAHFSEVAFLGNEDDIIKQIHEERFDVQKPYVISGAHFAEFYVRNFGIFYSAILDSRFGYSSEEWLIRERVTLQTLATHLALMQEAGKEYTTFDPIWSNIYTGVAVFTEPSDSLFAVYYTLSATINDQFILDRFPSPKKPQYILQTQLSGKKLLREYTKPLHIITQKYLDDTISNQTGLIKTDIFLSSARDGIKRQSSFYDNVIAWSTTDMARNMGIDVCPQFYREPDTCNLVAWKQQIINNFWDSTTGIFFDDLSKESLTNHLTSADIFITTSTRFLDMNKANERNMIQRQIAYVQLHKLDKPFPLRYAIYDQPNRLYWPVRYFAPSYMGESIWSHWGIEYLKTLILLSQYDRNYLTFAMQGMQAYKQNILRYGGYPELYDQNGTIFHTSFYKSILHTGWVVNYEQARMMLAALSSQ